jgi:mannosyltransferase
MAPRGSEASASRLSVVGSTAPTTGEGAGPAEPSRGPALQQVRILEGLLVVGVLVAGGALRVVTRSGLWIDEAISAQIASLPFDELLQALRHDGHPPLYYVVLHGWMRVAGDSDFALRSFSLLCSLLTLPLAWVVGRRYAGRSGAIAALVLLASSPFAIRYATEARMYALVMLMVLAAWLAVQRALEEPSWPRLLPVAVLSGALLLTQYWSFYLWVATLCVLAVVALRGGPRP